MSTETRGKAYELLRRLAANDERLLRAVLMPAEVGGPSPVESILDRRTRMLVRLSALLAIGAPTTTLYWAVDLLSAAGVDEAAVVRVLVCAAPAVGSAQVISSAQRLALSLGFDLELRGWDGC
ncbi:MAG: hypothetical protein ACLP01_23105 [Solirubrobacteraceae bacterium]